MIDVERLRVLVAFAEEKSVLAAADKLDLSQPTVSHHLARLAQETGSQLFTKIGRNLELTQEGHLLAIRGAKILADLKQTEWELQALSRADTGTVRIAAFPSAMAVLIPALITDLSATAPGITIELVDAEPDHAYSLLVDGEADLALTFRYPEQPRRDDLHSTDLFIEPIRLITAAHEDDPCHESPPSFDMATLADRVWITGCVQCRTHMLGYITARGVTPRLGYASDDFVAVQSLVAAGVGVSLLPQLALQAFEHPGVRVTATPDNVRTICLVARASAALSAPVQRVRDRIVALSEQWRTTHEPDCNDGDE